MGWQDRLKEAAYTPPSGNRLTFYYEDVSRESDKKTPIFTFPDKDGAYIQDLGRAGRRYPMRFIFWGDNYDTQAQAFFDALNETGPGVLEHPVYGRKDVVPTGTIRQTDQIKTAGNQAIIEVVLWETIIDLVFPTPDTNAESAVQDGISAFVDITPEQFAGVLNIGSSGETVGFEANFTANLTAARSAIYGAVQTSESVRRQFDAAYNAIITNINELVGDPARLATDTITLLRLPVQAAALISDKLDGYANIIAGVGSELFSLSFDNQPVNNFYGAKLIVETALISLIEATIDATFISKPEAIDAAESIIDNFTSVYSWADTNLDALGLIDSGEIYQTVQNSVSVAAGRLVEISFTLLQERIITLSRPRTPLDLVAELYGELDGKLDFFITSNNLVGTEILEVPAGREIRYYE